MGSHKHSKSKKDKSDKHKLNKSKNEIPESKSKKRTHKSKKHTKEDSVSTKVHKHDKSTQSGVEANSSSVDGIGKMSDPKCKNKISMVDDKINKCAPDDDGNKNDWNNIDGSIKMDKKKRKIKGLENDKRSIKSVAEQKKTEIENPGSVNKYKRISCQISSDDVSSNDDCDIVNVENSKPRKLSISDAFDDGSNLEAKPSLVKEVSNPVENTQNRSTTRGSKEEKPMQPESFLPKETMRIKRKKPKVATIKKPHNTVVFPHICADDEEDFQVLIPSSKINSDIDAHEDGEISSSSSEFDDGYDENLMGDKEDRERLSKLNEIDREFEIYKRSEEREVKKRHWEIMRRIKKNATGEANKITETTTRSLKRKEELEKVNAKKERHTAMAALVKQREKKYSHALELCTADDKSIREEEYEMLSQVTKRRKSTFVLRAVDIYSDDSCSQEEEEKVIDMKKPSTPERIHHIKTVQELNQIFISRINMEKLLYLPIFQKTVLNCFVRVKSGSNSDQCNYFVAEIIGFKECAKVYPLGNTISNTYLLLKNVTNSLTLSMVYISNEEFKENEFEKWLIDCYAKNVALPNSEDIKKKMEEITKALNYIVTDKDINKMVERKTALRQCPTNLTLEKACLLKDRNSATHNGDMDHVDFLNQKIKELEKRNGNKNVFMQRRHIMYNVHTMAMCSPLREAPKSDFNLSQENASNTYDPYTRRPTRPHKVVTSIGNKDDKFLITPPSPP